MRTTIRVGDALLREAKAQAARAGRSLNDFNEEAARLPVLASVPGRSTPEISLLSGGRGLRPRVHRDSNAHLLDMME